MGFFSSIVRFVKNVVKSILGTIAKWMNSLFGSPVVAALAMLIIGICCMGVGAFMVFVNNPLLLLAPGTAWFMASLIVNALVQIVSLVCPSLGRALGYAFGLFSFFTAGFNMYTLITEKTWTGLTLMSTMFCGAASMTSTDLLAIFTYVTSLSYVLLVASLAAGVDENGNPIDPYAQAFVDGFFAVPEVVADVADDVVSTALDSVWGWALLAVGAYFVITDDKKKDGSQTTSKPKTPVAEGVR